MCSVFGWISLGGNFAHGLVLDFLGHDFCTGSLFGFYGILFFFVVQTSRQCATHNKKPRDRRSYLELCERFALAQAVEKLGEACEKQEQRVHCASKRHPQKALLHLAPSELRYL